MSENQDSRADKFIREARLRVARQTALVDRLDVAGRDTAMAKTLLQLLREACRLIEDHRRHMRADFFLPNHE